MNQAKVVVNQINIVAKKLRGNTETLPPARIGKP